MRRFLLAAVLGAGLLGTTAPAPASALICGGIQYCLCPSLGIGCPTPQRCIEVWGAITCV